MSPSPHTTHRRPRLLIIGPMPPPYIGPAVATERLVNSPVLHEMFEIELLNTGDPKGLDDIGRFSMHNVSEALSKGLKCLGALTMRRPDVVYVPIDRAFWGFLRDLLFLVPSKLLGVKVVIHLRAGRFDLIHDFGAKGRMLARLGLWCAARGVVLGETVRDVFGGYIPPDRIRVVPNGIDLNGWPRPALNSVESLSSAAISSGDISSRNISSENSASENSASENSASENSVAENPASGNYSTENSSPGNFSLHDSPSDDFSSRNFHIVYLANLFRDKGAHVLLQALPLVLREAPHVKVSFAGEWIDLSFRDYCMELVKENGLENNVSFVGVVGGEKKKDLLASADLAAFVPVKPEGLPWVVLEAMASGKPVIGTPQGTMKEVIVDGETGFLIEPDNPQMLAERILRLVRNPAERGRMGAAGRERVETIYNEQASHRKLGEAAMDAMGRGFRE